MSSACRADGQGTQNNIETSNETDSWNLFSDLVLDREQGKPTSLPDTVLRSRYVKVDSGLLEKALQGRISYILFNLFDDAQLGGIVDRIITRSAESYSIIGRTDEQSYGSFILTVNKNVVVGNIRSSDSSHYQVMYSNANVHEIRQIDDSQFPPCALGPQQSARAPQTGNAISGHSTDVDALDDGSTLDVMIVYTANARIAVGGTTAMDALINLAIDETNIAYANSMITPRVDLVHKVEVTYDDSVSFSTTLSRLTNTSDGYMDNIHSLRDTYGADMVSIFIDNTAFCGMAWLMTNLSPSFESNAFSVVHWSCATGYYSFAHEMGHNMGCVHALPESNQGSGLYNYSMGWRFASDAYRTIMAYSPGTRIDHFSNPDVTYAGFATGVALGLSNEAHNALSTNNAADTVANWRQSVSATVPVAQNNNVSTQIAAPVTITLQADDDGEPDPPSQLTYIITSLPTFGQLSDPNNNSLINSTPYTLINYGSDVLYTPANCYKGADSIQFKANDGGTPPEGGDSNIATISITITASSTLLTEDFESAFVGGAPPGWTKTFETGSIDWLRNAGDLSGQNAHEGTYNAILHYESTSDHETYLVSPVIDFGIYTTNPTLKFWHLQKQWYGNQDTLKVYYKTSAAGEWTLLDSFLSEVTTWTQRTIVLPDPNSTYYIGFLGNAKRGYGVCVDDISVTADRTFLNGDLNCDDNITNIDFSLFEIEWLNTGCNAPAWCNGADITENGDVDIEDLIEIALNWTMNF